MFEHVLAEIYLKPWMILPEKHAALCDVLRLHLQGKIAREEIEARLEAAGGRKSAPMSRQIGSVAVIPVRGVISRRMNMMSEISGGTSIEQLTASFRQAVDDPGVKTILLDIDSPGGGVEGVPELAAEILAARQSKKVTAVADDMAASAAYWLASAANEICVTPSGSVGSIGVFAAHEDISKMMEFEGVNVSLISAGKYKTEANPYQPLSAEARASLQSQVDEFYGMFVKAVAKGRNTTQTSVREGFGQGRMVLAEQAVKAGMADRVETMDQAMRRLMGRPAADPRRAEIL